MHRIIHSAGESTSATTNTLEHFESVAPQYVQKLSESEKKKTLETNLYPINESAKCIGDNYMQ